MRRCGNGRRCNLKLAEEEREELFCEIAKTLGKDSVAFTTKEESDEV